MTKNENGSVTVLLKITPETWKAFASQKLRGTLVYSNKQRVNVEAIHEDEIITEMNGGSLHRYRISDGKTLTHRDLKNYKYIRIMKTYPSVEEAAKSQWAKFSTSNLQRYTSGSQNEAQIINQERLDTLIQCADEMAKEASKMYDGLNKLTDELCRTIKILKHV